MLKEYFITTMKCLLMENYMYIYYTYVHVGITFFLNLWNMISILNTEEHRAWYIGEYVENYHITITTLIKLTNYSKH
jgi:hypothetical protein